MMKTVMTVRGKIAADQMGRTLMHEHFLFGFCGFQGDSTLGPFREEEYLKTCIDAVNRAKACGFQTFVDATTNECGRNPVFLKKLAEETDVNILCATGFYHESESAFAYWRFRSSFGDIGREIYEMLLTEVTEGIEGTGIRAGVIKLASGTVISPLERIFFTAAARVNRETGVPIITHTQLGTQGPEQAELLLAGGADPGKIAIGHMCGNTDISYHEAVLRQGVFDAFDRFGLEGELFKTPTDEERVDLIVRLLERGWEDQILVSHDFVNVELGRPHAPLPMEHASIGNIGERVIPMLKTRGVTESQLDKLLIENPARLLGQDCTRRQLQKGAQDEKQI